MEVIINSVAYALLGLFMLKMEQKYKEITPKFIRAFYFTAALWSILMSFYLVRGHLEGWFAHNYNRELGTYEMITNVIITFFMYLAVRYKKKPG